MKAISILSFPAKGSHSHRGCHVLALKNKFHHISKSLTSTKSATVCFVVAVSFEPAVNLDHTFKKRKENIFDDVSWGSYGTIFGIEKVKHCKSTQIPIECFIKSFIEN